jgi:hypothetical protein
LIEQLARRALLVNLIAGAFLLIAGGVNAARLPSPSEAAGIRYAIAHDARTCCGRGKYRVVDIRVSSVNRSFASATVEPLSKAYQGAYALLWRGTKRWAVIDAGTDFLGCDLVTAAVRKDLLGSPICP